MENKHKISQYLYENDLYGVIFVDRQGGNYLLWLPAALSTQTGVSWKFLLNHIVFFQAPRVQYPNYLPDSSVKSCIPNCDEYIGFLFYTKIQSKRT